MKTKLIFLFLIVAILINGCTETSENLDTGNEPEGLPDNIGTPGGDISGEPTGLPGNIGTPPSNV